MCIIYCWVLRFLRYGIFKLLIMAYKLNQHLRHCKQEHDFFPLSEVTRSGRNLAVNYIWEMVMCLSHIWLGAGGSLPITSLYSSLEKDYSY